MERRVPTIRIILALCFFVVCVGWFVQHTVLPSIRDRHTFSDFPTLYFAASAVRTHANPYDLALLKTMASRTVPFAQDIGPYLYPPLFAQVAAPFTLLSYGHAKAAWTLAQCLLLALSLFFLYRLVRIPAWTFWTLAGGALLSFPLNRVLVHGQLELLLLTLLLGGLVAFQKSKHVVVGLLFGVAIVLKLYPAFFLLPLVLLRQWKTLVYTLGVTIIVCVGTFSFLTTQQRHAYAVDIVPGLLTGHASAQTVQGNISYAGTKFWPNNYSLSGLFAHTLTQQDVTQGFVDAPQLATVLYWIAALVLLAWTIVVTIKKRIVLPSALFPLWLITFLLINPLTWEYYLVLTLPALFWLVPRYWTQRKWVLLGIVLVAFVILGWQIYPWHAWLRHGAGTIILSIKTLALLALWSILLRVSLEKKRAETPQPA